MSVKLRKLRGSWYIVIDHNGQRKKRKVGGTLEFARGVARQVQEKVTRGDLGILNEKDSTPLFSMRSNGLETMDTTFSRPRNAVMSSY